MSFLLYISLLLLHFATKARACGYPGSPAHASVSFTTEFIEIGTVATYTCDNGYELLGPPRRTCSSNGTWVPQGVPFCVLNVAVGKAAMQSSIVGQGSAQRAVDGSTSTFYNGNTCTMTEIERTPWWYVNLLEPYLVQLVRIDFGASCCSNNRPAVVTVRVGNNRPDLGVNPICNKFTGFIEEGRPLFLPCARPMPGAFVSVHLESSGSPLSICETFVYTDHALSIEQCPSFRDQPLGSTSTYNGKCYIFYNNQPMNFENAKRFCEIRGGSLVDETSPALQGFLSWELYRRHRNDPNGQYWLGAVRDPKNPKNWKWINGKDVTISFWNLPGNNDNCSRFDGSKGWLWSDTNCRINLNFLCQHRPLSCGKPERPPNSTILARSVDIGSIIEYRCGAGNLLVGPNIRTCLPSGFFSEFSPKCKYLECGFPATISNGDYFLVNNSKSYLSGVQYSCKEGFVIVGRSYLTCDVDERWNGPPPRCEPILCPSPPTIPNGFYSLSSNSTKFGTKVHYGCISGFELSGDSTMYCSSAGYWEGQPPFCREQSTRLPPQIALIPISTTSPKTTSRTSYTHQHINTVRRFSTAATSTTRKPIIRQRENPKENEISDIVPLSKSNLKSPVTARLNMGGIIALGVFGGFVFLAAVVTIIIIIIRRLKNSRNSIDAQTISTFDSSGDQNGFYRNYQQAWENLRYTGHSATYKPSLTRFDAVDHGFTQLPRNSRSVYNEGFRDTNEITLNADVAALYSRPEKQTSRKRADHEGQSQWQHSYRKY
ncbi:sushi: von Willebrand factor type A: EGF and pentraxin domain-containing protein 1-like protein [Dinothrombium tinctorium]|uniref:Sushi: von Willebrand factor type A: EGF and pentraxin domain-containing protein 1-like protein n=1 Tax=Dinothrombium tinctorium TaxID=1965070 RepID=A0A3S3P2M2_9ACAR|nr:sushi: von Willebrand factor type A: EGF and pentraxin domain-containing protein 1-like protein [Dinothrombium tinctorium]